MSISQPSREIYVLDIPEVRNFLAQFKYNFFVPDESVSETGGIPTSILSRPGSEIDTSFIQYSMTRAPRFVAFNFSIPKMSDPGKLVTDFQQHNVFEIKSQNGSLISDNIKLIVTEDQFASNNFIAVNFNDGELSDKVYYFVSGSLSQHTLEASVDKNVSTTKGASQLSSLLPRRVQSRFVLKVLNQPSPAYGTSFFNSSGQKISDASFDVLNHVSVNSQLNGKLFHDIVNRTVSDPQSPFSSDMIVINKYAKKIKQSSVGSSCQLSEDDFKTTVPYVSVKVQTTLQHKGGEIVGFIIDKTEIMPDGNTKSHAPIIIDNPRSNACADFRVKYNSTYSYSIRTIAQFELPAVDEQTNVIAMLKVLVSSKPSNKIIVRTHEAVAPPPPTDLNFTWDYERINPTTAEHDYQTSMPIPNSGVPGSLLVHWTFPPNSQRDIKKFQLFRRKNISHPFELIKMYDFDDSYVLSPNYETPAENLIEHLKSPATFFFDDEFDRNSKFIYAVASIDAHGMTSNYSAQFELSFDVFKNSLVKKLISHTGAPKPYPNLYLEADAFVDTIRVQGPNTKKLKVYFNPEYYYLTDDDERVTKVLSTNQTGGSYKLQFINIDNQKSAVINITIDDQVNNVKATSKREIKTGPQRKTITK